MGRADKRAGIGAGDDVADRRFHGLKSQPVTAGRQGIAALAVWIMTVRVPAARPHPVDEFGRDAVALDG